VNDEVLRSWHAGPTRRAIVDFVSRTCGEDGSDPVPPEERVTTLRRCTFGTASSSRRSPGATRLGVAASSPALRSHCQLGSSDDASSQPSRLERTRDMSQEDRSERLAASVSRKSSDRWLPATRNQRHNLLTCTHE
jgi:hypothetical protein